MIVLHLYNAASGHLVGGEKALVRVLDEVCPSGERPRGHSVGLASFSASPVRHDKGHLHAQEFPKRNCIYIFTDINAFLYLENSEFVHIMAFESSGLAMYHGFPALSKGGWVAAGELEAKKLKTHACLPMGFQSLKK